ncbi:hypothetical protein MBANPS3_003359 [Mucor bainieri]
MYVHMMLDQESRSTRKVLKRWQSVIKVFSIAWFLYGNYLVFFSTAVTCALTAPPLFNLACVVVLYGYVLYVTPLITLFLQHVLIPCIVDILQLLHIIERDNGNEPLFDCSGASNKEIAELPTYHLLSTEQDEKTLLIEHSVCDQDDDIPAISIPNQDRVCVICLSLYEESDILCKLWCKHHFHKKCISEWLILNALCPLCKQDCRDHSITPVVPTRRHTELKDPTLLLPL